MARRRIRCLLYRNFEMLDVFGPLQMFKTANACVPAGAPVPGVEASAPAAYDIETITLCEGGAVAGGLVAVESSGGPAVLARAVPSIEMDVASSSPPAGLGRPARPADASTTLLIPGGAGTRGLVHDAPFTGWLAGHAQRAGRVATVCTGSALLARTGLLDGVRATSNKLAFDWVARQGPRVQWQRRARWVRAETANGRAWWTSSGVGAGMDMALAMIEEDLGRSVADSVARRAEYVRQEDPQDDPFARDLPQ